jgi:hypothetical protein
VVGQQEQQQWVVPLVDRGGEREKQNKTKQNKRVVRILVNSVNGPRGRFVPPATGKALRD